MQITLLIMWTLQKKQQVTDKVTTGESFYKEKEKHEVISVV